MDYLRGYAIFPLNEAAVPPRWLPLVKTYENLYRDAVYYGFIRFEVECTKWLKRLKDPQDKQAVLRLDFNPFIPGPKTTSTHPLTAEMLLDCHLADIPCLRKRYLKAGLKSLTYGPMPWKRIFEQIQDPQDRDAVLQYDGSAIVDIDPRILKPPRGPDEHVDDRKLDLAKLHVSKAITQTILEGIKPTGMSNYVKLRFHATEVTTIIKFDSKEDSPERQKNESYMGQCQFIFHDKPQSDGYLAIRALACADEAPARSTKDDLFPLDKNDTIVFEVDSQKFDWGSLCQWSKVTEKMRNLKSFNDIILRKTISPEIIICEKLFGGTKPVEMEGPKVLRFSEMSPDS